MLPLVLAAHNWATTQQTWAGKGTAKSKDTFGSLLRPSMSPVSPLIQVPGVHKAHVACTQCPHVVRLIRPPLTGHSAHAGCLSGPAQPHNAVSTDGGLLAPQIETQAGRDEAFCYMKVLNASQLTQLQVKNRSRDMPHVQSWRGRTGLGQGVPNTELLQGLHS